MPPFPSEPDAPPREAADGAVPIHVGDDGVGGTPRSDAATFASLLCLRHHAWAVDRTVDGELPGGWRELAERMFADISRVAVDGSRFVVGGLLEEGGRLVADVRPFRVRRRADPCRAAVELVVAQAMAASLVTCQACGAPGRPRERPHRATLCDLHAEVTPVAGDRGPGDGIRVVRPGRPTSASPCPVAEPFRSTPRLPLYELDDVEAALGRRRNGRRPSASFFGDPEDRSSAEPNTEQASYLQDILDGGEDARWRNLVVPGPEHVEALVSLDRQAPHMREATELVRRHLRAAVAMGAPTTLPPLMLLGEPGTGKTWYVDRLARLLGLPVRLHPMNVATVGDGLLGSHPVWRGARPGLIARTLLGEASANPVVVVDEVDKARGHDGCDPYRPLYGALEPACSRRLVDEYLSFPIDASRVTWILAGNALDPLPAPILDRLVVLEVPAMDGEHLRAVAASVFDEANGERRGHFEPLPEDVAARLATVTPRRMRRAVVEAMVRAAADGRRALVLGDVVVEPRPSRRRAGFGAWP